MSTVEDTPPLGCLAYVPLCSTLCVRFAGGNARSRLLKKLFLEKWPFLSAACALADVASSLQA